MMQRIEIMLANTSYDICIGQHILEQVHLIGDVLETPRVVIITDNQVASLFLPHLICTLQAINIDVQQIIISSGEINKNWQTLNTIFDGLLAKACDRNTTLIALGGGVVGDMVGLAAAIFHRGVPLIHIPTTLLAQVDASIGGKTAINHPMGKNMIGAFYQPKRVLIDIATLKTLPMREYSAGLAEVIKCALINDLPFFNWLETHIDAVMTKDEAILIEMIARSCQNKADIVMLDEKEKGVRALLNLGHTFAHAIEAGEGFGNYLHGEAVAMGLVMAALLSQYLGYLDQAEVARIRSLLQRAHLPIQGPNLGVERYLALMATDKKVQNGRSRFILLNALGEAFIDEVSIDILKSVLQETVTCQ